MGERPDALTHRDPLAGSPWSDPRTVEGFVRSSPNDMLLSVAADARRPESRLLDIGCGAGRNAAPLARAGWRVTGTDLSAAMLVAAARRLHSDAPAGRCTLVLAPMAPLPFASNTFDFVVAHGIWNLARSGSEFRAGVREAARVARLGATLFVFTFSRHTLLASAQPVPGESFVFTQFSGRPQCFLTEAQLVEEMRAGGFAAHPSYPIRELNRPSDESLRTGGPVIYEAVFVRR